MKSSVCTDVRETEGPVVSLYSEHLLNAYCMLVAGLALDIIVTGVGLASWCSWSSGRDQKAIDNEASIETDNNNAMCSALWYKYGILWKASEERNLWFVSVQDETGSWRRVFKIPFSVIIKTRYCSRKIPD